MARSRFDRFYGITHDIFHACYHAFLPTIIHFIQHPSFSIVEWHRVFFAYVWERSGFAPGMDENLRPYKIELLTKAKGVVVEIGAGHGHSLQYLNKDVIKEYVAIEPNQGMHKHLREMATKYGFIEGENFRIVPTGLEQVTGLRANTIYSILTFCSIPNAQNMIPFIAKMLEPGGQFLFLEHTKSHDKATIASQEFWNPVWRQFFDGCELTRPIDEWFKDAGPEWKDILVKPFDNEAESEFPHWYGWMTRK